MANDIKENDDFKSLKRRFTNLSQKLKSKNENIKKKAYRVAKKIVIGALDDEYENNENGDWDFDSDFFFEGEGEDMMKIFQARDASVEAVSLLDDFSKEDIKNSLIEMIDNLNPNMVGGKRKRKTKRHRKEKKSKKSRRV